MLIDGKWVNAGVWARLSLPTTQPLEKFWRRLPKAIAPISMRPVQARPPRIRQGPARIPPADAALVWKLADLLEEHLEEFRTLKRSITASR